MATRRAKGSPLIFFRAGKVDPADDLTLRERIEAECKRLKLTSRGKPPDVSEWVRRACLEKLAHVQRSKRPGRKRPKPPPVEQVAPVDPRLRPPPAEPAAAALTAGQ